MHCAHDCVLCVLPVTVCDVLNCAQVWPFKDPTYDLKRATLDRGAQAVPVLQEAAVQVMGAVVIAHWQYSV